MKTIRITPAEGNKFFCMAPWTHTFASPQGERRLCCASREEASWQKQYIDTGGGGAETEFAPPSLEEHWNSEKMRSVRLRMMAGERLPECQVCNDNVLNMYSYRSYFTEQLFNHKIQEAFASTGDNGVTAMKPISFDYRFSNLCNFKCVMCGEQLSSSWETEKRMLKTWNPTNDKWMVKDNRFKIKTFQEETLEKEFIAAVKEGRMEEIYWVGGEPLMWGIHWWAMKYLVDNDMAKNVAIRYNTNLSRTRSLDGSVDLYDLLPHFKRVNLCASIDATGETVEFVRHGIKWDEWLDNFKRGMFLREKYGNDAIVFDVTLTLPGMVDLPNLMAQAHALGVKSYVKLTFDFDASAVMSPMAIPHRILDPLIHKALDAAKHIGPSAKPYVDLLHEMLKRPTFDEKYPDYKQKLAHFKRFFKASCNFRNNYSEWINIISVNPDLLEWWNSDE